MHIAIFKHIMYAVSRAAGARLTRIDEPVITPNFHAAELDCEGTKIYVLCTLDGCWAFSVLDPKQGCRLAFVDSPALSTAFCELFQIEPMSSDELLGPFVPRPGMWDSDIKYWKPKSLGEAIFNWWD